MKKYIDFDSFVSALDGLISKYESDLDSSDPFYEPVACCVASSSLSALFEVRALIKNVYLEKEIYDEVLSRSGKAPV